MLAHFVLRSLSKRQSDSAESLFRCWEAVCPCTSNLTSLSLSPLSSPPPKMSVITQLPELLGALGTIKLKCC